MTRLCIVFDRLRSEEKMLKTEAESLGCAISMLDAKTATLSTDTTHKDAPYLGDVILERCVSYFRGLHITAVLESMSAQVINTYSVASTCGNKMIMTMHLKRSNVPTPKTHFAFSSDGARDVFENSGYPLVIKPVIGSWGRGVMPIRDADTLDAVIEGRTVTDGPFDRIFYLQEVIQRPPPHKGGKGHTRHYHRRGGSGRDVSEVCRRIQGKCCSRRGSGTVQDNAAHGGACICSMQRQWGAAYLE